jgi:hypothetical protein
MSGQSVEREQRVTPLELFIDLVVVFAITQVTHLIADDLTWRGLGIGSSFSRRSGGLGSASRADERARARGGQGPRGDVRSEVWRTVTDVVARS